MTSDITMYLKHAGVSISWIMMLGSHSVKEEMSTLHFSWSAEADFLLAYLLKQLLCLVGQTDGIQGFREVRNGSSNAFVLARNGMKTIDSDKGLFAATVSKSNQYGVPLYI